MIPTSLVQLPSPPALDTNPSWGVQGCSWSPRTFPGYRDELELLHTLSMDLCSLPGTKPSWNTWPGLQENRKSRGEALLDQCWKFPEPQDRGRTLCPGLGLGTPWRHIRAHKHSLCPCNTTQ